MNKINILILMLLIAPIFTFLILSQENTTNSPIIYLHQRRTKATTSAALLKSLSRTGNVILQFYADWCGPCRRMSPIIDAFAHKTPGYTFIRINRDHYMDLAQKFNINSIPTLIFLRNGKKIGRYDGGPLTEKTLAQLITRTYIAA